MDYRLKLVKYLSEMASSREKELLFYQRLSHITPEGWDMKVIDPGKDKITNETNPDLIFTRKKDGKSIKVEAKSLFPYSSKKVKPGETASMSHNYAGTQARTDLENKTQGNKRWVVKTPDDYVEWEEHAKQVYRKSDLHIIGHDDELHVVFPHESAEKMEDHIKDFLKSSNLGISHFITHITKSGNPSITPAGSKRGESAVIRTRLRAGISSATPLRPNAEPPTFYSEAGEISKRNANVIKDAIKNKSIHTM
jgi:hypothetical protein